ncbi:MAG: TolC family protein, partial [Chlamydiia bacterium]|nr:TolC family protein [Chlamydiia bacterium]
VAGEVIKIISDVRMAYYELQSACAIEKLRKDEHGVRQSSLQVAQALLEAGNIDQLQWLNVALMESQADVVRVGASNGVIEAREKISRLLGTDSDSLPPLSSCDFSQLSLPDFSQLGEVTVYSNLRLMSLYAGICAEAAKLNLSVGEIQYPGLGLGIAAERDPKEAWFIGPQMSFSFPIFDWGDAAYARGEAVIEQLWCRFETEVIRTRSEIKRLQNLMVNLCNQGKVLHDRVAPIQEQQQIQALLYYNAMDLKAFDLLELKVQQLNTELAQVELYKAFQTARVEIEAIIAGYCRGQNPSQMQ